VGQNGALNAANNNISLRGGEIRLGVDALNSYVGQTDAQYGARNLFVKSANAVLPQLRDRQVATGRPCTLGNLTMRMDDADRVFTVNSIGTSYMQTVFNGTAVTLKTAAQPAVPSSMSARQQLPVWCRGIGSSTTLSARPVRVPSSLQKRNGGVLILNADNTYSGDYQRAAGAVRDRPHGCGGQRGHDHQHEHQQRPQVRPGVPLQRRWSLRVDNMINTNGGNDGSQRIINVGPMSGLAASGQEVRVTSLDFQRWRSSHHREQCLRDLVRRLPGLPLHRHRSHHAEPDPHRLPHPRRARHLGGGRWRCWCAA
jgi:autotransporter-associated beta strand protein